MNTIMQSLFARKSVRVFEDKQISKQDKEMILDAAIQAPSAGNQTMYTIIDVTDQSLLDKLAISCDNQPFIASAKMACIYCCDFQKWYDTFSIVVDDARKPGPGDLLLGVNDALIAAQNSVVAAESLGIGSCYIGDIMEKCEYHRELLGLPEYVFPVTMLVYGYPTKQQQERKKPARFTREHIVHENGYRKMEEKELITMFEERATLQGEVNFDFHKWMEAFYNRKYNSDFSKEMSRSVHAYYQQFLK